MSEISYNGLAVQQEKLTTFCATITKYQEISTVCIINNFFPGDHIDCTTGNQSPQSQMPIIDHFTLAICTDNLQVCCKICYQIISPERRYDFTAYFNTKMQEKNYQSERKPAIIGILNYRILVLGLVIKTRNIHVVSL